MSTFANDISSFDWSSMLSDIEQQRVNMDSQMTTLPSTITPKQELVGQQVAQEPSPVSSDDNDVWFDNFLNEEPIDQSNNVSTNGSNTNTTTSPLEFSSLFDVNEREECDSLFSSNVTSLDNSPLIKAEEINKEIPKIELLQSAQEAATTTDTKTETKKPKKKRAPRKRLTPHQKQAHNKIEKRYRININAKIAGLQQIIPWVACEKTAFEIGDGVKVENDETEVPRLNKSMILEKATAYILHLQENDKKLKEENERLRKEVERMGGDVKCEM